MKSDLRYFEFPHFEHLLAAEQVTQSVIDALQSTHFKFPDVVSFHTLFVLGSESQCVKHFLPSDYKYLELAHFVHIDELEQVEQSVILELHNTHYKSPAVVTL